MTKQIPLRQRIRKFVLILSFLLFPITMNYLSPYLIIAGASEGILTGSMIAFGVLFLASLFLGRAWCGWVCPGGAIQEIVEPVNNRPVKGRKMDWIKWLIWIPWISLIVWLLMRAGGFQQVNPLFGTEHGISIAGSADRPIQFAYLIYYIVIALFMGLAVIAGRRAGCHTICWMAPFMMIGRWIRNRVGWASLRLKAQTDACIDCKICNGHCPMSLPVNEMVLANDMEHSECILCGSCVDYCPKDAIHFSFSSQRSDR